MALPKVTQSEITATALRRMAKEMILQAEALEAQSAPQRPKKHVEFLFTKKNRMTRKDLR